jgi:hypothetical protein
VLLEEERICRGDRISEAGGNTVWWWSNMFDWNIDALELSIINTIMGRGSGHSATLNDSKKSKTLQSSTETGLNAFLSLQQLPNVALGTRDSPHPRPKKHQPKPHLTGFLQRLRKGFNGGGIFGGHHTQQLPRALAWRDGVEPLESIDQHQYHAKHGNLDSWWIQKQHL